MQATFPFTKKEVLNDNRKLAKNIKYLVKVIYNIEKYKNMFYCNCHGWKEISEEGGCELATL